MTTKSSQPAESVSQKGNEVNTCREAQYEYSYQYSLNFGRIAPRMRMTFAEEQDSTKIQRTSTLWIAATVSS